MDRPDQFFKDRKTKLYFKKNGSVVTIKKTDHPILWNYFLHHYNEIAKEYEELNKDKKIKIFPNIPKKYFTNESFEKLQRELKTKDITISVGFSSTEILVYLCNASQMEYDTKIKEMVGQMGDPTEAYKSYLSFL